MAVRTLPLILAVAFSLMSLSCSDSSGFAGSNGKQPGSAPVEPNERPEADEAEERREPESRTADATPEPAEAPESEAPESAVTKGSFTAWAEPARPAPRQAYWIHVEVRLPAATTDYPQADLAGRLVGTDGYSRGVGRDSKGALDGAFVPPWVDVGPIPQDQFQFNGQTAKISIWVPGAERLVRDTISISSDRLEESQSLEIVFQ
jgi:hypothetical protein